MTDLIKRLETAEQGSRELDREIWNTVFPGKHNGQVACYSTSLSAAVALVERALPGWEWLIRKYYVCLWESKGVGDTSVEVRFMCPVPLGLCTALLKALKPKEPSA